MSAHKNLLIVDDDAEQRRSLVLGLTLCGFSVLEASDGEAALSVLNHERVDVALVDLMMPGVNGVQLLRQMRLRHPHVPVLLTSGYHLSRSQLERIGGEAVVFVPKPYNMADLSELLTKTAATSPLSPHQGGGAGVVTH